MSSLPLHYMSVGLLANVLQLYWHGLLQILTI
jgi:hypothetical protein